MKMNMKPKETLAGGQNIVNGDDQSGLHNPSRIVNTNILRSEFVLDVLDGCAFNCAGCYIPRRNTCTPYDIRTALQISDILDSMSVVCEDLFIGPTDIFTATNFDDIMSKPNMFELTSRFALSATSTLMSDNKVISPKWNMIQEHLDKAPARDFDMLVAFNLQKYIERDNEYLDKLKENLIFFENDSVYFIVNYTETMFNKVSMYEIASQIKEEFNVPFRVIPSFFRINNSTIVATKSEKFKETLFIQLYDDIPEYVQINMLDKYFGGEGFINLSYKDGNLYVIPFLFEGIPQTHDIFKIEKPYSPENITNKIQELITRQYQYASHTMECADCNLLSSCVGRKILAYMESRDLIDCIVPKENMFDSWNK